MQFYLKGKASHYFDEIIVLSLAALGIALSLLNNVIGIPTGFGMTVDLSAVPVFIALFMLSYRHAAETLGVMCLGLAFLSPAGIIGAGMKFFATLPLIAIPYAIDVKSLKGWITLILITVAFLIALYTFSLAHINNLSTPLLLLLVLFSYFLIEKKPFTPSASSILAFLVAILVRGIIMAAANLYLAIPLFFKLSPSQVASFIESHSIIGGSAIFIIVAWNAIQSVVELSIAYATVRVYNARGK